MGSYYNRNTRRFLLSGHGARQLAIHRAVWGPGVASRDRAIEYVNDLILDELESIRPPADSLRRVADLGCGVGGSMIYLRRRMEASFVGATISAVQADLARAYVRERGLSGIEVAEADFTSDEFWSSCDGQPFDAMFAVESFVHVPELRSKLPAIARRLRRGGRLIVVDDMISREAARRWPDRRERRWLREFEKGWYAHGLGSLEQLAAAASQAGLVLDEVRDLTAYLELDRPRDLLARVFISGLRWLPLRPAWFDNFLGGNALQLALKRRLLGYYYVVFAAREDSA